MTSVESSSPYTTFGDEENGKFNRRAATKVVNEFKRRKARTMAVSLSGLPGLKPFVAVDEPATLAQRWLTWKQEFELYVIASGISDPTQMRVLLLHLSGASSERDFQ